MATRTPHTATESDDFEPLLGPAERRYFGTGYKRTRYDITAAHSERIGAAGASGRVHYAQNWSTKSGSGNLAPHLSTVDAAVLSTKMAEVVLASMGLSASQVGGSWIECLSIRAGARPLESLESIPLTTSLIAQSSHGPDLSSTFESRIGSLAVSATVRHPLPEGPKSEVDEVDMDGPLTTFYRMTRHRTWVLDLDTAREVVRCRHEVQPGAGGQVGLESKFWPAVTLIDCLVLAGQMAQALIFGVDRVDRNNTNNLWMRRASFEASAPVARPTSSEATMSIVDRTASTRGDRPLNGVSVETSNLFDVRVKAALAYFGASRTSLG